MSTDPPLTILTKLVYGQKYLKLGFGLGSTKKVLKCFLKTHAYQQYINKHVVG